MGHLLAFPFASVLPEKKQIWFQSVLTVSSFLRLQNYFSSQGQEQLLRKFSFFLFANLWVRERDIQLITICDSCSIDSRVLQLLLVNCMMD